MAIEPDIAGSLSAVLAAAGSGICLADARTRGFPLTFVNPAFEALTGYSAAESVGRSCSFLQSPQTDPEAVARLAAALRDGRDHTELLLNVRKDGTPFWNELRLSPIRDAVGEVSQVVGVQRDATEEVHARQKLASAASVIARQDQELAELRAVQEALTPPTPSARPGLELAVAFRPAEDGLAGDFHLVTSGPGDATVVVVGDVIGHGMEAAHRATYLRTALSTFARFTDDPQRLLEMANHALIERIGTSAEFVTAVCATYRPSTQELAWATAGHHPPTWMDTGEPLAHAGRPGLPLGIEIDLLASSSTVALAAGRGVLLYTDGLPEARPLQAARRAEHALGGEAVTARVRELAGASAAEVVGGLRDLALDHVGTALADDLCVVGLRAG